MKKILYNKIYKINETEILKEEKAIYDRAKDYSKMVEGGYSYDSIRETAYKIRKKLKYKTSFDDYEVLENIVKNLGGRIVYTDLACWNFVGTIFYHEDNDFDIIISRHQSKMRDKSNIGFELGHYFLHGKPQTYANIAEGDKSHNEAVVFMRAFFMTLEEAEELYKKHNGSEWEISKEIGMMPDFVVGALTDYKL